MYYAISADMQNKTNETYFYDDIQCESIEDFKAYQVGEVGEYPFLADGDKSLSITKARKSKNKEFCVLYVISAGGDQISEIRTLDDDFMTRLDDGEIMYIDQIFDLKDLIKSSDIVANENFNEDI